MKSNFRKKLSLFLAFFLVFTLVLGTVPLKTYAAQATTQDTELVQVNPEVTPEASPHEETEQPSDHTEGENSSSPESIPNDSTEEEVFEEQTKELPAEDKEVEVEVEEVLETEETETVPPLPKDTLEQKTTPFTPVDGPEDSSKHLFHTEMLELGEFSDDIPLGYFTIRARDGKEIRVNEQNRKPADSSIADFTKRLQTRGKGDQDFRSIAFETYSSAKISIYALSATASDSSRRIGLYNDVTKEEIDVSYVEGNQDPIDPIIMYVDGAGEYYLTAIDNGVNFFAVLVEDDAAPPEREDWANVATPTIDSVTVNDAQRQLDIDWTAEIGQDGGDVLLLTLTTQDGTKVDEVRVGDDSSTGTSALSLPSSGTYTVEIQLQRANEEPKVGTPTTDIEVLLPLLKPQITDILTLSTSGNEATVQLNWNAIVDVEGYKVRYNKAGETPEETQQIDDISIRIPRLTIGEAYEFILVAIRGTEEKESDTVTETISGTADRWLIGETGGDRSKTKITGDLETGLVIDAVEDKGKLASSEDQFRFYYTTIDPETENFTLTATFKIESVADADNQSGFGIIAIDHFENANANSKYFNSAGTVFGRYKNSPAGSGSTTDGIPGGKFIRGYEGSDFPPEGTRVDDSLAFDLNFRNDEFESTDSIRYNVGDEFTLSLRKSNTGFHAILGEEEIIWHELDALQAQDPNRFHLGMFATRGISVSVHDIEFTVIHPDDDDPAEERPETLIDPNFIWNGSETASTSQHITGFKADVKGSVSVKDHSGAVIADAISLNKGLRADATLPLVSGKNDFTAIFTPAPKEEQDLREHEDLTSYDPISMNFSVTLHRYGKPGQAMYVTTDGSPSGNGTKANPLDLTTAIAFAQPGQQIVLREGTYKPTSRIVIPRGNDGTAENPIMLLAEPGANVVFDLSSSVDGGFFLRADYWHFYDFEVKFAGPNQKALYIQGNNNIIERIVTHSNGETGLQIAGSSNEDRTLQPENNLILSCESYNNSDPSGQHADGFAAKLTVGDGNTFRYCISHHNIDDGWDLYAKSTTGSIGIVTIDQSVTYNNGYLLDGSHENFTPEGNGFKLGGESMPGPHVLKNSISYGNRAKGIAANNGPDVKVYDVTTYNNGAQNFQLNTPALQTDYDARGVLSYKGAVADYVKLEQDDKSLWTDESNHFDGRDVEDDWFKSLDTSIRPTIAEDGSIDMHSLLELTDKVPTDTGARIAPNPDYTPVRVYPEVSVEDTDEPSEPTDPVPPVTPSTPKTESSDDDYVGTSTPDITPYLLAVTKETSVATKTVQDTSVVEVTSFAEKDSAFTEKHFTQHWAKATAAAKENQAQQVVLRGYNYTTVSKEVLDLAHKASQEANLPIVFRFDNIKQGIVTSRISIIPSASNSAVTLQQDDAKAKAVTALFTKHFETPVQAIAYEPSTLPARMAVKLSLENTENLVIYSYDAAANTYSKVAEPNSFVDSNGYLHFTAPVGIFVLAENDLVAKQIRRQANKKSCAFLSVLLYLYNKTPLWPRPKGCFSLFGKIDSLLM